MSQGTFQINNFYGCMSKHWRFIATLTDVFPISPRNRSMNSALKFFFSFFKLCVISFHKDCPLKSLLFINFISVFTVQIRLLAFDKSETFPKINEGCKQFQNTHISNWALIQGRWEIYFLKNTAQTISYQLSKSLFMIFRITNSKLFCNLLIDLWTKQFYKISHLYAIKYSSKH